LGARVGGVLLLALSLGLSIGGFNSGVYEPLAEVRHGTVRVEECERDGDESPWRCDGTFSPDDGTAEDPYADIGTDVRHAGGERLERVLQIGGDTYATSVDYTVLSGLRMLFAGLCVLGPAVFALLGGRAAAQRSEAGRRRAMVVWKVTFPLVCISLLGVAVTSGMR
jgi:hypothetical protein